jgi:excisionase family DNA binding protein
MSTGTPTDLLTQPVQEYQAALLDVGALAALLNCSERHVYRLSDRGAMPAPVRLGALVRWRRLEIVQWISEGCPSVRKSCR